jgi:hypothetical protein
MRLTTILHSLEKEKLLNEALSHFDYKIPDDPEFLLYDFYMSTLLEPSGLDDDLDYQIEDTKRKLYPYLKQHMMDALWFAIVAEFRYILKESTIKLNGINLKTNSITTVNKLTKQFDPFFIKSLYLIYSTYKNEIKTRGKDSFEDYDDSNRVIKKIVPSKLSQEEFIRTAQFFFNQTSVWREEFGGDNWGKICEAWFHLNNAKTLNDMLVWIDHAYDLQHNNGSVLTKIKKYYKDSGDAHHADGFKWLDNALEFKKDIKSPYDLWSKISKDMKTLAGYALKKKEGTTLEREAGEQKIILRGIKNNETDYTKDENRSSKTLIRKENNGHISVDKIYEFFSDEGMDIYLFRITKIKSEREIYGNVIGKYPEDQKDNTVVYGKRYYIPQSMDPTELETDYVYKEI